MNLNLINKILFCIVLLIGAVFCYLLFSQKDNTANSVSNNEEIKQTTQVKAVKENNIADNMADFKNYKFKYTYTINIKGALKSLNFKMPIPVNEEGKQYIDITSISEQPQKYYDTPNGRIAEYIFNDLSSGQKIITFEGSAKVRTYDLTEAEKYNRNTAPGTDLSLYLKPERLIESNDNYIIDIANKIQGNTREEILQNIYEYLQKNIKYTSVKGNIGAKQALKRKQGKCSEYAAAMIAICRAKNIPARIVSGDILREQYTPHAWVEVYFDRYGWVAFDPTHQGIHIKKYMPDGTVSNSISYNSKDTGMNYIALSRNKIDDQPINYDFYNNKQGKAYLIKNFNIE